MDEALTLKTPLPFCCWKRIVLINKSAAAYDIEHHFHRQRKIPDRLDRS